MAKSPLGTPVNSLLRVESLEGKGLLLVWAYVPLPLPLPPTLPPLSPTKRAWQSSPRSSSLQARTRADSSMIPNPSPQKVTLKCAQELCRVRGLSPSFPGPAISSHLQLPRGHPCDVGPRVLPFLFCRFLLLAFTVARRWRRACRVNAVGTRTGFDDIPRISKGNSPTPEGS